MDARKIVKFNLYMGCVLLVVLVLVFIGVSIAYFTSSKQVTNTFTAGTVEIELSESAVKEDASGNLVENTLANRIFGRKEEVVHNYERVYPGMTICKDPTIANIGSGPAWIAAKVTLTDGNGDLHKLIGYEGYEDIDIELLLQGALLDEPVQVGEWNGIKNVCYNDHYAMIQIPHATEGRYEFFFLILQPLEKDYSVTIFDKVVFNMMWSNEHMNELRELKIHVQAYGVQTFQMTDCLQAMTLAFPDQFPFSATIK